MNLARQNPALYATFVEELRSQMNGNVMIFARTDASPDEGRHAGVG